MRTDCQHKNMTLKEMQESLHTDIDTLFEALTSDQDEINEEDVTERITTTLATAVLMSLAIRSFKKMENGEESEPTNSWLRPRNRKED